MKKEEKTSILTRYLVDGEHEAIIDTETWEKVQIILKDRSKTHNRVYDSE